MGPTLNGYGLILWMQLKVDCCWLNGVVLHVDCADDRCLCLGVRSSCHLLYPRNPNLLISTVLHSAALRGRVLVLVQEMSFTSPVLSKNSCEGFHCHVWAMTPVQNVMLRFWVWNPCSWSLVSALFSSGHAFGCGLLLLAGFVFTIIFIILALLSDCLLGICHKSWLQDGLALISSPVLEQR